MTLRVAYLINGLNGGGAALPVADVILAIRAAGHRARVIALMRQNGRAQPRLLDAGVDCRVLGPGRLGARSLIRLLRELRRDRPDVIWTSLARATMFGQLAGRLLGIPVVSWQHNAFLKPINIAILKRSKPWTRLWVADSEAVRDFAIERLGIAPDDLLVWPLFIANPDAACASPWRPAQPFRIGSLGRLHPNKRYDVLIRAAARMRQLEPALMRDVEIVIGGSGEEEARLQALAVSLGVERLRFEGYVERPQTFLAGLHAYAQPSHHEGLCLAAHEAMQAALPVVTTPVGQLAYSVIEGQTGLHVPVDDVEALAISLLALVRDPARAAAMGRAGRARVLERFGRPRFEAICRQIMEKLVAER